MFLMDSGKFEGANFKSDVCQLVNIERFSRKTHFHDGIGRQKIREFSIVSLSALCKALFASVIK